jgi:archaellum component FlaC
MENKIDPNFMRDWIRSNGSTPMPQDIGLEIILDAQKKKAEELKKDIERIKEEIKNIEDISNNPE